MFKIMFNSAEMPKYHESMLIVKMKRDGVALDEIPMRARVHQAAFAGRGMRMAVADEGDVLVAVPPVATTPGIGLLEALERGGMVKRITALAASSDSPAEEFRMGALAVQRGVGPRAGKRSAAANAGVSIIELHKNADPDQLQKALADDPQVELVSRVPVRYLLASRRAPTGAGIARAAPPAAQMWNLRKIEWAQARAEPSFREATEVNVAVLDTGVDMGHPDLLNQISKYVYLHPDTASVSGEQDIIGHGTHVTGIIGALINNAAGINGICQCRLNVWKIFPDQATYSAADRSFSYFVDPVMYLRALADCLDEDIDVINLSIGGPGIPDHQEAQLFNALTAKGTTIVAAMGNERQYGSPTSFPAAIPGVIAVGATGLSDSVTNFSNRGDHIVVCAPGKGIWSTLPTYPGQFGFSAVAGPDGRPIEGKRMSRETDYDSWDGTSMASPHVAAAAALLIARQGSVGPAAVRAALSSKSDAVAAMGGKPFDSDYGFGRLNLLRLLN